MMMNTIKEKLFRFCQSASCRACTDETIVSGMCI